MTMGGSSKVDTTYIQEGKKPFMTLYITCSVTINCLGFTLYIQKLGIFAPKLGLLAPKIILGDPVPTLQDSSLS